VPYLRSYYQGDYMGGYRGDPGFFKKVLKIGKRVAMAYVTGGTSELARLGAPSARPSPAIARGAPVQMAMPAVPVMQTAQQMRSLVEPVPGIPGAVQRFLPGGRTGFRVGPDGQPARRRRMNVANAKALRRAIRRQAGFVKLARKALKGTGYTIVSRGSRSRRPVSIKESGPGSVIVR